jgi:hypothetical protein
LCGLELSFLERAALTQHASFKTKTKIPAFTGPHASVGMAPFFPPAASRPNDLLEKSDWKRKVRDPFFNGSNQSCDKM